MTTLGTIHAISERADRGRKTSMADAVRTASAEQEELAGFRARFPLLETTTYLNIGARGLVSIAARETGHQMIDGHGAFIMPRSERRRLLDEAKAAFSTLIHAKSHEISAIQNCSQGINIVATAIDWRPGDNVVLCADIEHPNNVFIWLKMAREHGVELRFAPMSAEGGIDAAAIINRIDRKTRVVAASSATLSPCFQADLAAIGPAARASGALFLVDAIQTCGVLDMDVERLQIDALVTSTAKGLLGLMGFGFLFVREAIVETLTPAYAARFNIELDGAGEDDVGNHDYRFHTDSRRFEVGNYNWTGAAVAAVAIRELVDLRRKVDYEAHALALADSARDGLARFGFPVARPQDARLRSHLVTVGAPLVIGGHDAEHIHDPRSAELQRRLASHGITSATRRGLMRLGFHAFNSRADVTTLLNIARSV